MLSAKIIAASAEGAHARWPSDESLLGNSEVPAVHGGVVSTLADPMGAAPFVGSLGRYTSTVDLRADYLSHAGGADLKGHAEVRRRDETGGVVDVVVESAGDPCAETRTVYEL